MIPFDQCITGRVYSIHSRNLAVAVYAGDRGFIGIRQKFNSEYLDTEYGPGGTVGQVNADLGPLPPDVEAREELGTYDAVTRRDIEWDATAVNPHEKLKAMGWYRFVDTKEPAPKYPECWQMSRGNDALFAFLKPLSDAEYVKRHEQLLQAVLGTCLDCAAHLKLSEMRPDANNNWVCKNCQPAHNVPFREER